MMHLPESLAPMKTRILLAEDNPINHRFLQAFLVSAGYEIDVVEDGSSAVRACTLQRYDVVIMDCEMPVLDGPRAARLIRQLDIFQPKIIALTARAMTGDRHECLRSGMDGYVSKPFRGPALLNAVRVVLGELSCAVSH